MCSIKAVACLVLLTCSGASLPGCSHANSLLQSGISSTISRDELSSPPSRASIVMQGGAPDPKTCDEHGAYCFVMNQRLGNNLFELGKALQVASVLELCAVNYTMVDEADVDEVLHIPRSGMIRLAGHPSTAGNPSTAWKCAVDGTGMIAPPLLLADYWGEDITEITDFMSTVNWQAQNMLMNHENFRRHLFSRKRPCPNQGNLSKIHLNDNLIVMHMRSGDVINMSTLKFAEDARYLMPCSFYEDVMLHGNGGGAFAEAWIVTAPERDNPCIAQMQAKFPNAVHVQSDTVLEDACVVMSAKHLACDESSFSQWLALLNPDLQNMYIRDEALPNFGQEEKAPWALHVYTLTGYPSRMAFDHPTSPDELISHMTNYTGATMSKHVVHPN